MKVLLYYTSNKRTIAMETMVEEYIKAGHEFHFISMCEPGELHEKLRSMGVKVTAYNPPRSFALTYYWKHISFLASYCRKNKIDLVLSHLQQANIIAVFAQFFTKAPFYIFRHHDYAKNRKEKITDKLISIFARHLVVPSGSLKEIARNEGTAERKIMVIPYIYDFNNYRSPDPSTVATIRKEFEAQTVFIMISRLVPEKRHLFMFEVFRNLVDKGFDIKLLVMDDGSEKEKLVSFVHQNKLDNRIFFMGFRSNIIDYLDASDILLHPSVSEASCSAVKEAGMRKKIALACSDVGDFDDYLIHLKNALVINKADSVEKVTYLLQEIIKDKKAYRFLGEELRKSVLGRFSNESESVKLYLNLLNR